MARRLTWLSVAVASLWPAVVPAHRSVARELVVQLDARGAVALWQLRAVGPEATVTLALWDHDRNGRLTDGERIGAALSLLASATRGVVMTWDGEPLRASELEPRLEQVGERSATAVGLATLRLPAARGRHVLRIEVEEKSGPLAVQVQVLDDWQLGDTTVPRAADGRGLAQPVVLVPGRALELAITGGGDRQ